MNVSPVITTDYDKLDTWSIRKNEPKTNPKRTQTNPNEPKTNPIKANKMPKQTQFKPKQTQYNAKQTQFHIILACFSSRPKMLLCMPITGREVVDNEI
jgi:hypothetical protein